MRKATRPAPSFNCTLSCYLWFQAWQIAEGHSTALPPGDWKLLTKACLSEGDYLLWKTEFAEQRQATAGRNRAQQVPMSSEMLVGEGPYTETDQQSDFDVAA